jgi:hypothetical protein
MGGRDVSAVSVYERSVVTPLRGGRHWVGFSFKGVARGSSLRQQHQGHQAHRRASDDVERDRIGVAIVRQQRGRDQWRRATRNDADPDERCRAWEEQMWEHQRGGGAVEEEVLPLDSGSDDTCDGGPASRVLLPYIRARYGSGRIG